MSEKLTKLVVFMTPQKVRASATPRKIIVIDEEMFWVTSLSQKGTQDIWQKAGLTQIYFRKFSICKQDKILL